MGRVIDFNRSKKQLADTVIEERISSPEELKLFIDKYVEHMTCIKVMFSFDIPEENNTAIRTLVLSNSGFTKEQAKDMVIQEIQFSNDFKEYFIDE